MSSFPNSVQGSGTMRVQLVETVANKLAPTLTEINAVSAFDASAYFRAEDFQIAHEQPKVPDTRLSDLSRREQLGQSAYSIDVLRYIHNPQAAVASATNKAYEKFVPGTTKLLVIRFGTLALLSGAALAATQRVQLWDITFGDQHQPIPVGDNPVHVIEQQATITLLDNDYTLPAR